MSESAPDSQPALRLFMLAIAVRLTLWLILGNPHLTPGDDQTAFLAIRDKILTTGQFLDPETGLPLAYRDAGYPVFLAALSQVGLGAFPFVWAAQILLSSLTGVFLWFALRSAAGEKAARYLGGLFLLHLGFASYSFIAYSETMACCLAGGLLLALEKWRRRPEVMEQAIVGAFGAATILTRFTCFLGAAGLIAAAAWGRLRFRRTWATGTAVLVVPLLLWTCRNAVKVGVPVPNTCGIFQLHMGNNPQAPLAHSYRSHTASWDSLGVAPDRKRARIALQLAAESAIANPGLFVTRALLRIPDALEGDRMLIGVARRGQFPGRPKALVLACGALVLIVTGIPTVLALAAVINPGPHWLAATGRWMFLGLLLTQVLTIAHSRYSMPGWILLLPGAALMVERLERRERAAGVATVVAAVVLMAVWSRQILLH